MGRKGTAGSVTYSECDFWPIDTTYFVTTRSTASLEFLYYLLKHEDLPRLNESTGVPGLNRDKAAAVRVLIPPPPEQRRIAEILSSVDEAIQTTQAVIEQTRTVQSSTTERIVRAGMSASELTTTEVGEVPPHWGVKRLDEIAEVDRGRFSVRPRNDPRYYGGDIPFVQTGDVVAADGVLESHSQTLNNAGLAVSKLFPTGTILVTIAANIGETAVTAYPVCCPDSLVGIQPKEGMDSDWLRAYLSTQQSNLDKQATRSAQKNINLQHLRPLLVPVPPRSEQAEIGNAVRGIRDVVRALQCELTAIRQFKAALMSDLLTGRKRVTSDLPLAAE